MLEHIIINNQLASEVGAKQRLGNIISGRTEPAGEKNDVGMKTFLIKCKGYFFGDIANCHSSSHPYPDLIQFLANKRAVGINGLTDQQFITNGNYRGIDLFQLVEI